MADQLNTYEVTKDRFIGGQHHAVGDTVKMTERAAKYYLPPHGTGLNIPGARTEKSAGLSNPNVKKPTEHAPGKPGK